MPKRINLDQDNPTLRDLLQQADDWKKKGAKDLTPDQIALINLKEVLTLKDATKAKGVAGGDDCFICYTGA